MDTTRVLVADDNIMYRWGLVEALGQDAGLEVVEEASDGNEAVEKALALKPHVVLMDLHMPTCDGLEATRRLVAKSPQILVLVNTVSDSEKDLVEALKAGARGYLLKNEKAEVIVQAIQYIAKGGMVVSPAMAAKLVSETGSARGVTQGASVLGAPTAKPEPAAVGVTPPAQGKAPGAMAAKAEEPEVVMAPVGRLSAVRTDVDLVIPPPIEPGVVLRLHKWLKDVAKAEIHRIDSSLGGDTVLSIAFRQEIPLPRMLAKLEYVEGVAEEPQAGKTPTSPTQAGAGPGLQRYRLALKKA